MKQHKRQNLPFVLYRKPNSKTIIGVFQENDHVYFSENSSERGFVFAPFQNDGSIVFPLEFSEINFGTFKKSKEKAVKQRKIKFSQTDKNHFIHLVEKAVATINKGVLNKVVVSRTETVLIKNFKYKKTFDKLLQHYSTAFCYYWFHPKVGTWMGATPEKLLQTTQNNFATMALAGTQKYNQIENINWEQKEIVEQEIVTQFIVQKLQDITSQVTISEPYTAQAGNIMHLKTDIEGVLNDEVSLQKILDILQPTPAVCGLPKEEAKQFITENEGYNREFYTGFLGELNFDFNKNEEASDLFVNLRCMKISESIDDEKNKIKIFMGCGITKDSNPEAEWEETVHKSKTIKNIL
ncbi:isochorismate synthase [Flavobacterium sp.]|uniref:isochorismate synthase n=1 Tax=Flavobacterium sp. TaxID=239 RepID=UPI00286D70AD|nr:isochorismate synthase [Flavobacterium sp.]